MNLKSVVLTSCVCLMAATVCNAAPQNVVTNGNFEQITKGEPLGWTVTENPDLIKSRYPVENGRGHVAQIELERWDAHGAYFGQSVVVKPHTRYRFSLNACMNTGNIRIGISGGEGDDKVNIAQFGRAAHLSMYPLFWDEEWSKYLVFSPNEWRPVTIDFDSGNATNLYISFGSYQRKGIYSFDDVSLVEVPK